MLKFKDYFLFEDGDPTPTNVTGSAIAGTTIADPPAGTKWIMNAKHILKRKPISDKEKPE